MTEPDPLTRLATTSYSRWRPPMGQPVATSVGHPRWFRGPAVKSKPFTPFGVFGSHDTEFEYRIAYVDRLESYGGVDGARDEVRRLLTETGAERLVLLCWCNLDDPANWCHRRMAAEWIHDATGIEVPELGLPPAQQTALL